jgi:hypothetical protein
LSRVQRARVRMDRDEPVVMAAISRASASK